MKNWKIVNEKMMKGVKKREKQVGYSNLSELDKECLRHGCLPCFFHYNRMKFTKN